MSQSAEPIPSAPPSAAGGPRTPVPVSAPGGTTHHSRRRVAIGAALILLLLLCALALGVFPRIAQSKRLATAGATATDAVPTVGVVKVTTDASNPSVVLPGTLQPTLTTAIYGRAPGYIGRILVDIGSHVHAGDLLAVIDAPEIDQQVLQARGVVAQNRASVDLARLELRRWRSLAEIGAVTADDLDLKATAFSTATAMLSSAEAALRQLLRLQGYERVVAPFTGVITQRNVDPGALVGTTGAANTALAAGSGSAPGSLLQIAKVESLSVYVNVPEEYSMGLKIGTSVVVTVPQLPGDTVTGRITKTSRSLDPTARTLLTEIDFANKSGTYLPGMYAQVQMRLDQVAEPIHLPATGLVIRGGPPQVVVVRPDSTVQYQNIQIGRDHGAWLEVTGGLAKGATIVVNAPDDLQNGARVRTVSADTAAAGYHPPVGASPESPNVLPRSPTPSKSPPASAPSSKSPPTKARVP
jgi:RND family efflux transporter MFP subunit